MLIEMLIREEVEALNKADVEKVCSYYTEDVVFLDVSNVEEPAEGIVAFKAAMYSWYQSFPDLNVDIKRVFSSGDGNIAVAEYVLSGTHRGNLGEVGPTYKRFKVVACSIYELRDGKFCKETLYWDTSAMLKQLSIT